MISVRKRKNIYCFDASAFIDLGRTHEQIIEILQWDNLEKMMHDGQVISHILVFNEISSHSKKPDFITKWIVDKKAFFLPITLRQIRLVPDIIKEFPDLIDYQNEHEQADSWLIALAIEKSKEQTLFYISVSIVVSQENPRSPQKIPAVCKFFSIRHESLREFTDDMKKMHFT